MRPATFRSGEAFLMRSLLFGLLCAGCCAFSASARAGDIYLTDSPDNADLQVFITNADHMSEVACWISQAEIDSTLQPGDLKLYVTQDPNANATWIGIADDPSEADPLDCLKSD